MIKPIRPEEITHNIPDFVIEAVNKLIKKNWNGREAIIKQDEIMALISSNDPNDDKPSRREIYEHNWLDFENLYREAGWVVMYDKPGYNERYDAYFQFRKQN